MAVYVDTDVAKALDVLLTGHVTEDGDTWELESGTGLLGTGAGTCYPSITGRMSLDATLPSDYWADLTFDVKTSAGVNSLEVRGGTGTANRYSISWQSGVWYWVESGVTVHSSVSQGTVGPGSVRIRVQLDGSTLRAWIPGLGSPLEMTDASLTGGRVGFWYGSGSTTTAFHYDRLSIADSEAELDTLLAPPPDLDDMGPDNAAIYTSPCNWEQTSTYLRTNQQSAYIGWKFSGTYCEIDVTDCVASLDVEPGLLAGDWPKIAWQINGGEMQYHQLATGDTVIELADDDTLTGTPEIFLCVAAVNNGYDLYTTGGYYFGINEIRVLAGETLSAPTTYDENWLLYGDSTVAGWNSASTASVALIATSDATSAFPLMLRKMKQVEIGVKAVGGQGFCVGPNNDDFPPFFTPANDTESTWNKTRAGVSILSSGNYPRHIHRVIVIHGRNDHASAVSDANVEASLEGFYAASKAAAAWQVADGAPPVKHDIVVPFGGGKRSILTSTTAGLRTTDPDVTLHDLFADLESHFDAGSPGTPTEYTYDQIHPGGEKAHGIIAGRLAVALTVGPNRSIGH